MHTNKILVQALFLFLAGTAFVQVLFTSLQHSDTERALSGLTSIMRTEEIGSNPYKISAELLDLANSGLFAAQCLKSCIPKNLTWTGATWDLVSAIFFGLMVLARSENLRASTILNGR